MTVASKETNDRHISDDLFSLSQIHRCFLYENMPLLEQNYWPALFHKFSRASQTIKPIAEDILQYVTRNMARLNRMRRSAIHEFDFHICARNNENNSYTNTLHYLLVTKNTYCPFAHNTELKIYLAQQVIQICEPTSFRVVVRSLTICLTYFSTYVSDHQTFQLLVDAQFHLIEQFELLHSSFVGATIYALLPVASKKDRPDTSLNVLQSLLQSQCLKPIHFSVLSCFQTQTQTSFG